MKSKEVQAKAEDEIEDYVDTYYYPSWKSNSSITWSKDNFSTTLSYYYTGTATGEDVFLYLDDEGEIDEKVMTDKLDAYKRVNWSMSYRFDWKGKLKFGVKNLTDEMPPYYSVWNKDYNDHPFFRTSRGYNTIGRTVYIGYDQSF